MKTIYLECNMGAAGDMLMAALLELHPDPDEFLVRLNQIGLPGVEVQKCTVTKCGIQGTSVSVLVNQMEESEVSDPEHGSTTLKEIESILQKAELSPEVYRDTMAIYHSIAEAESEVHGVSVEQVHFHELGMMDAIVDIVGVCMLLQELSPVQIFASAVNVGSGYVRCAHGLLPVPAPAAAKLLSGIPIYSTEIKGELCTPTGAALLKYFVSEFIPMPVMRTEKIGYGMGKKDFPTVNCLRAFYGETEGERDTIWELQCNLDDMTPEELGFAMEVLLEHGALDVFTTPIGMKKCRPGTMLTCLCRAEQKDEFVQLLFQHTTTLGVREQRCTRSVLKRAESIKETPYGAVRIKESSGYGVQKIKAEYEDLAAIARERKISLLELKQIIAQADDLT